MGRRARRASLADFPRLLQAFFTDRLVREKGASPNTVAGYRDTFRLLLAFAERRLKKTPSDLWLKDLDAPLIGAFLHHLEKERGNTARSRNVRLSAIHSFYKYAARESPQHSAIIQRVIKIQTKKGDRRPIDWMNRPELSALLSSPDKTTRSGRRDHALLVLGAQTGLRCSELAGLRIQDVELGPGAYVHCIGKGRKERDTPLRSETVTVMRRWLRERGGVPSDPVFPSSRGGRMSRDAIEYLVKKHVAAACENCPTLARKRVSPHVLRHTAAMDLLHRGVDRTVIAIWLGHEDVATTQMYLDADLALKEKALSRTAPFNTKPGRYKPEDDLLAFLKGL